MISNILKYCYMMHLTIRVSKRFERSKKALHKYIQFTVSRLTLS